MLTSYRLVTRLICIDGQTCKLYCRLARRAYTVLIKEQIEVVYDTELLRGKQVKARIRDAPPIMPVSDIVRSV